MNMEKFLSASKAGFPCRRNLWYAVNKRELASKTEPKTQRIFDVGTCLEPLIVEWLRQDGWTVEYNPGSQEAEIKVEVPVDGGKLVGHPDAIISRGELQNVLVDIKTMNDRSFTLWQREGTEATKSQYVTQLHIYAMGLREQGRKIEKLGIVGVNKNNSEMYINIFPYNELYAYSLKRKTEELFSEEAAPVFHCPAEKWACNYCEYAKACELYQKTVPVPKARYGQLPVTTDNVVIAAMHELKQSRELAKEADELEKHAKSLLDENVRNKGLAGVQGGGLVFWFKIKASPHFDKKGLQAAYPDIAEAFTTTNTIVEYKVEKAER